MEKEISICCITYNQKKYIEKAISSFLNQSIIGKCEILIHDDASTDGTVEILKEYAEKYPDIVKIFLEEKNQYSLGDHQIFPRVFKYAKGKYVALCEGDDNWIDTRKLEVQYEFMENHKEFSMCFHATKIYNCKKQKYEKNQYAYPKSGEAKMKDIMLKGGSFIPTASIFCRKKDIENLPDFFYRAPIGDYPLQLILASKGKVYYHNNPMSLYREYTETSVAATLCKSDKDYYSLYKSLEEMLISFSEYTNFKYSKLVKMQLTTYKYNVLRRQNDIAAILSNRIYRRYFFSLPLIQIIKTLGRYILKKYLIAWTKR